MKRLLLEFYSWLKSLHPLISLPLRAVLFWLAVAMMLGVGWAFTSAFYFFSAWVMHGNVSRGDALGTILLTIVVTSVLIGLIERINTLEKEQRKLRGFDIYPGD